MQIGETTPAERETEELVMNVHYHPGSHNYVQQEQEARLIKELGSGPKKKLNLFGWLRSRNAKPAEESFYGLTDSNPAFVGRMSQGL